MIGLGSMFGGILEVSGGAQQMAQTLIRRFGQKKAGWALGLTGLVLGTTVFFEAGVVILIPLAFNVAKQDKKINVILRDPSFGRLASGYAFVPPSAGSVLVANALGVNLGTMMAVGIPVALISTVVAGIIWGKIIGNKIYTKLPANVEEIADIDKNLPSFGIVFTIILIPLILILFSTISGYLPIPESAQSVLQFLGEPFVALTIATLTAMYMLGTRMGYNRDQLKKILDHSLRRLNDSACNRKWRSDSLDAAGFGTWKYHWTDPGKERDAADRDRISHCVSGTCFCGKFNRSNDDGFRDHGVNAGYGRQLYTVQSSDVLCDLWRSDGTESCK